MKEIFERILLLKGSDVFSQASTEDLRAVAQALELELYTAGDRIFTIGDQGDHMYIIQSGQVGISTSPDPKSKDYVVVLGPGDAFGEMNLIDELPRSATAYVVEDAEILALEKARLRQLIIDYPELSLGMLKSLSLRLRRMTRLQHEGSGN